MLARGMIAMILALTLVRPAGTVEAAGPAQSHQRGLFGTITTISGDHPRAVAGETDITLATAKGPVKITATFATTFRLPGREQASLADLAVGDAVAILASDGRAVNVLVKPSQPVRSRHLTGVVTAVGEDGGTVEIWDGRGRLVSAPALPDLSGLQLGDLVTAVLEPDQATGSLLVTGLERATDSLGRLQAALEKAQTSKAEANLAALRQRLAENSAHHLTILQNATHQVDPTLRAQLQRSLDSSRDAYSQGMARFNTGKPSARVSGIVTSIDEARQSITVAPAGLPPLVLVIPTGASLKSGGKEIRLGQLDLASRVEARYDLESRAVHRLIVLPAEALHSGPARAILAAVDPGEFRGKLTHLGPHGDDTRQFTLEDWGGAGGKITLTTSKDSVLLARGQPVTWEKAVVEMKGPQVLAIFEPSSKTVIEVDTLVDGDELQTVSGVVHSLVAKVVPGNLSVLTREGDIRAFTWTDATVIRRDGRLVRINELRLGDRVRANTRFAKGASAAAPPELTHLSLKSPSPGPIHGTIRGVATSPQSEILLTISTPELEMVSLVVDANTQLTRPVRGQFDWEERPVDASFLAVGQLVRAGSTYHPLSERAVALKLEPPRSAQVSGKVTAASDDGTTITITTRQGDRVKLDMPKPGPAGVSRGGKARPLPGELRVGDRVRVALYDVVTHQVLKLVKG